MAVIGETQTSKPTKEVHGSCGSNAVGQPVKLSPQGLYLQRKQNSPEQEVNRPDPGAGSLCVTPAVEAEI